MKRTVAVVAISLSVVCALGGAQTTFAASWADGRLSVSESIILQDSDVDITNTWGGMIGNMTVNDQLGCTQAVKDSFNNKKQWAVTLDHNGDPVKAQRVNVVWTDDASNTDYTEFLDASSHIYFGIHKAQKYYAVITLQNGEAKIQNCDGNYGMGAPDTTFYVLSDNYTNPLYLKYAPSIFLSTYPSHLPDGYEGVAPPAGAIPKEVVYPNFKYSKLGQTITANYEDNIPYEAKGLMKLTWLLSEDMDEGTGQNYEVVDTKTLNYDEQYKFNVSRKGNYILSLGIHIEAPGIFDKEIKPTIQGILIDGKSETLSTTDGSCVDGLCQETTLWQPCLLETFPFIDMGGCIHNMASTVEILTFDTINLGTPFKFAEQCYTLGKVGDWLGLEGQNRNICPAISSDVRNVITPFVTFAFSLMGIKYITSRVDGYRN